MTAATLVRSQERFTCYCGQRLYDLARRQPPAWVRNSNKSTGAAGTLCDVRPGYLPEVSFALCKAQCQVLRLIQSMLVWMLVSGQGRGERGVEGASSVLH